MHRLFAAAAAALAVGLLYAYDPAATTWFPSCPFRALTGLLCPLCGTLRAAHAVLHGHLVAAFLLNPLVVATALLWPLKVRLKANATSLIAALAFTIVRNLL